MDVRQPLTQILILLGHSERRTLFHETSAIVAQKTRAALDSSLKVILCIGESLQERETGKTAEICKEQLKAVVDLLKESDWTFVAHGAFVVLGCCSCTDVGPDYCSNVVIAYEPVWAIGTGKVATPAQAQEAHADIRSYLSKAVSPAVASSTRIIYGGSVTAKNSKELGRLI